MGEVRLVTGQGQSTEGMQPEVTTNSDVPGSELYTLTSLGRSIFQKKKVGCGEVKEVAPIGNF